MAIVAMKSKSSCLIRFQGIPLQPKIGTTTFTITEGKLVIEGAYIDVDGNKKLLPLPIKRITEKELAALRAMEYKAP